MIGLLKDLLSHQAWADAVFFWTWGASGALEDEDLRTRTDHMVAVQEAFIQVLKGHEAGFPKRPLPAFKELKARCEASHQVLNALGRGLDEAALAKTVRGALDPGSPLSDLSSRCSAPGMPALPASPGPVHGPDQGPGLRAQER